MNARIVETLISKIEKENEIFSNKGSLDSLSYNPKKIIGRQKESKQLLRHIIGYKKGYLVPLVSIYGRSGSGKSTLVKYICEQLDKDIQLCFVNLRQAKTVFGAANVILTKLGKENVTSASGINNAIEQIGKGIKSSLESSKKKLLVLVLDEFDVLFFDKRSNPSDFVYKLIEMEGDVRKKGTQCCILTISNSVLFDYELDDRVRSRIGNSEVFFTPYTKQEVLEILTERTTEAFSIPPKDEVLQYCAKRSYLEHGDARRAIDLLRVAAEIASSKNESLDIKHVDLASERLQKDRIEEMLSSVSYHFKVACLALTIRTYGLDKQWHSTHQLYKKYCELLEKNTKPVTHRRFSEILKDLENTGVANSQTGSHGRKGYFSQFRLTMPPEIVGNTCFPKYWQDVKEKMMERENLKTSLAQNKNSKFFGMNTITKKLLELNDDYWS